MKRLSLFLVLLLGGLALTGCASDPNVEGAKLDLRNKDYDQALENINTAIENNPQNAEAYRLKGDILQTQASEVPDAEERAALLADMIEAYDQAVEIDPEVQDEVEQQKLMAYVQEMQRGGETFQQGAEDNTAYGAAAQHFENAAMVFPDSASAHLNQAYSLLNTGEQVAAIEPFERAVEAGENSPDTYRYLGELYLINDQAEEAVDLLETAAEQFPEDEDVQARLLNAYIQSGMIDEAMQEYASAVERNPDDPTYRYNYGSLLLEAEQYEEAAEQLRQAVELDPEYADAQYNLGASYINQAVAANERIRELDNQRSEEQDLTEAERQELEQELEQLVEERRAFFEQAVDPLEQARDLVEASGDTAKLQGICQALYQSYVQTGQDDLAQETASCAGYED